MTYDKVVYVEDLESILNTRGGGAREDQEIANIDYQHVSCIF